MTSSLDRKESLGSQQLLAALFVLGLVACAPFFSLYSVGLNDEAVVALGAERLLGGELPYRDWNTRFPPLSYFLTAGSFALFGPGLTGLRFVMVVANSLLALVIFLLSRRLMPLRWALACWALVLVAVGSQIPIVSYHVIALVTYFAGLNSFCGWVQGNDKRSLLWAGTWFALTGFSLQTEAAALLLAGIAVAFYGRSRLTISGFLHFLGALFGVSLLLWGPLVWASSFGTVWQDNVADAVGYTKTFNESPYSLTHLSNRWSGALSNLDTLTWNKAAFVWVFHTFSYLLVWTFEYGLFFPIALVVLAMLARRRTLESPALFVVAFGFCAFLFISKHRMDMLYLKYLTPLWYVLLCWMLWRSGRLGRAGMATVLPLYAVFYLFNVKEAVDSVYPIFTPRGVLFTHSAPVAQWQDAEFRLIAQTTPPGSTTFFYPYACANYFWGGVKNAIKPPVLVPLLYSEERVEQARLDLEASRPALIYHVPLGEEIFSDYPRLDRELFLKTYENERSKLFEPYELLGGPPGLQIYRRK